MRAFLLLSTRALHRWDVTFASMGNQPSTLKSNFESSVSVDSSKNLTAADKKKIKEDVKELLSMCKDLPYTEKELDCLIDQQAERNE